MKAAILPFFALLTAFSARADLAGDFARMSEQAKGPFGLNMLQGTDSRHAVNTGRTPKNFLFQAAYRNDAGRALAELHGFYVGNLFTTNYYELMGEFVFGDAHSDHPLDHSGLLAKASLAMPKAALMVQHWVLEKHYIEHFQSSKLARSFKLRGISGSEFEQVYANHFFNFYLSSMGGEFQYLPAFLLVNLSPTVDSSSLQRARDLITTSYDYFFQRFGKDDPMVAAMYKLRNAIHNQLSKDVIKQIDAFVSKFPLYKEEGHTYLFEIRKILVNYYGFRAEKIAALAKSLGQGNVQAAAERLASRGSSPENLVALSRAAADLRTYISDPDHVSYDKRAATLALLATATQFLNRELSEQSEARNKAVVEAVVNTVYTEGFLIVDNWEFFVNEAVGGAEPAALLADVIEIASGGQGSTLNEAFSPALGQWISIEPRMQYFLDNTVKSSALNTAAVIAQKAGR